MVIFSLAPMLDVTTPSFVNLIKMIKDDVVLFSEMFVDNTIVHAPDDKLDMYLKDYPKETIIQIGGSDPKRISRSVGRLMEKYGFTSFNLNCGCPSDRVRMGRFGAVLMREPELVCEIINRCYEDNGIVLSIKCRIGVEDTICDVKNRVKTEDKMNLTRNIHSYTEEDYLKLYNFIETIKNNTKCRLFYIHCRKCILKGFSPKDNREIPPLDYSFPHRIKEAFPDLYIHINGGIKSKDTLTNLNNCDGFMIGRGVWDDPFIFLTLTCDYDRFTEINRILMGYFELYEDDKIVRYIHTLPLMNMFKGMKGKSVFKQILIGFVSNKVVFSEAKKAISEFLDKYSS